jgi:ornithine cyclodeaminase
MPPDPRDLYGWMMAQADGSDAGRPVPRPAAVA